MNNFVTIYFTVIRLQNVFYFKKLNKNESKLKRKKRMFTNEDLVFILGNGLPINFLDWLFTCKNLAPSSRVPKIRKRIVRFRAFHLGQWFRCFYTCVYKVYFLMPPGAMGPTNIQLPTTFPFPGPMAANKPGHSLVQWLFKGVCWEGCSNQSRGWRRAMEAVNVKPQHTALLLRTGISASISKSTHK